MRFIIFGKRGWGFVGMVLLIFGLFCIWIGMCFFMWGFIMGFFGFGNRGLIGGFCLGFLGFWKCGGILGFKCGFCIFLGFIGLDGLKILRFFIGLFGVVVRID